MADSAIQQMVIEVLTSVLGAQPGLEMPLVQAGLDSLGEQYTPCGAFHLHAVYILRLHNPSQLVVRLMWSAVDQHQWCSLFLGFLFEIVMQAPLRSGTSSVASWHLSCQVQQYSTILLSLLCANSSAPL